MASVKLIDQPPADEVRAALYSAVFAAQGPQEDICLTLLSDLSNLVPPDAYFDFHVDGLEISKESAFLMCMVDNSKPSYHYSTRCEIKGMSAGYHLMRCFLIDAVDHLCIKHPNAYVEAEFFVSTPTLGDSRHFMFGQPSLCHIRPRVSIPNTQIGAIVCDFFVHNCEVSSDPSGYSVNVYVNATLVANLREWKAFVLTGATFRDDKVTIRMVLVNPAGEEMLLPKWNAEPRTLRIKQSDKHTIHLPRHFEIDPSLFAPMPATSGLAAGLSLLDSSGEGSHARGQSLSLPGATLPGHPMQQHAGSNDEEMRDAAGTGGDAGRASAPGHEAAPLSVSDVMRDHHS